MSNYGIWGLKNLPSHIKDSLNFENDSFYLISKYYDNHELNSIFLKHETNFIKLIDPEEI